MHCNRQWKKSVKMCFLNDDFKQKVGKLPVSNHHLDCFIAICILLMYKLRNWALTTSNQSTDLFFIFFSAYSVVRCNEFEKKFYWKPIFIAMEFVKQQFSNTLSSIASRKICNVTVDKYFSLLILAWASQRFRFSVGI